MKKYSLILIITLFQLAPKIEAQNLEPANSVFEIFDYQFEYYSKIRTKLFNGLSDKPELRLVKLPSFSPEEIFQIEQGKSNNYYAKVNSVERSIWYDKNYDEIKLNSYESVIDQKDVYLLGSVYKKILKNVHQPIPWENTAGLDGTTYYFSAWNYGLDSGVIWSPRDSISTLVIKITDELIEEIRTKKSNVSISEINRQLLTEMNENLAQPKDIEGYNLINKVKAAIELNKNEFLSQLNENHKIYLQEILVKLEKKMLIQFAYNNITREYLTELILESQKVFEWEIEGDTHDKKELKPYFEKLKNDNIFGKIIAACN